MNVIASPAELSRRDAETRDFNKRRDAARLHLENAVRDAVKAGVDVNLPSYLGNGRMQFWSISSMLVGAGGQADKKLLEACSCAVRGATVDATEALREFVELVAEQYGTDNVDEACPHPDF